MKQVITETLSSLLILGLHLFIAWGVAMAFHTTFETGLLVAFIWLRTWEQQVRSKT